MRSQRLILLALGLAVAAVGVLTFTEPRPSSAAFGETSQSNLSASAAPDDSILVVSSKEHALIMLDPASADRMAFFRVGLNPDSVAVSPDGRTAVVTNRGERISGNSICVIDLYATNLVRTIPLESSRVRPDQSVVTRMYHRPTGVTFMPGGTRVLVSCAVEGALLMVDLIEARVIGDVLLGEESAGDVVVDHAGEVAYVANRDSGTVSVVMLDRMRVVHTIEAGGGPTGMELHPTRNEIWVTNAETNSISIIDVEEREERLEFSCGAMPVDISFTPDGNYALVANMQEGNVSVIETRTRRIKTLVTLDRVTDAQAKLRPVKLPGHFGRSPLPSRILIDPEGERAWITTRRDDQLHELSLRSWKIRRSTRAVTEPIGVGWSRTVDDGTALRLRSRRFR